MSTISFDNFTKLDIRVGRVHDVETVTGSKKLIKIMIDIGGETRQCVAGIGSQYQPDELQDKQVIVIMNLAPRKIFGIESQVMLLAAVDGDIVSLLQPDKKTSVGAKVG